MHTYGVAMGRSPRFIAHTRSSDGKESEIHCTHKVNDGKESEIHCTHKV